MKKIAYIHRERVVVRRQFSCGLSCQFPWPHNELQPKSPFLGHPPIFLGRSLDLLWALWGQLRFWFGLILPCTCFQSPQLPLNSTASNMGTPTVYWDIPQMQGLPRPWQGFTPLLLELHEQIPFVLFGHIAPGAQRCCCPRHFLWAALHCLFPVQTKGGRSSGWGWSGLTHLLRPGGGGKWQTQLGNVGSACGGRGL